MGSQRVRYNWVTELNWSEWRISDSLPDFQGSSPISVIDRRKRKERNKSVCKLDMPSRVMCTQGMCMCEQMNLQTHTQFGCQGLLLDSGPEGSRIHHPTYITLVDYFELKVLEKQQLPKGHADFFLPLKVGNKSSMWRASSLYQAVEKESYHQRQECGAEELVQTNLATSPLISYPKPKPQCLVKFLQMYCFLV